MHLLILNVSPVIPYCLRPSLNKAAVAICVVLVDTLLGVGDVGAPVNAGLANGA
jgi:hypothetical protein